MAIRAFIAIEIDSEIKKRLSDHIDKLKRTGADVKWVIPENIHLTLKFLTMRFQVWNLLISVWETLEHFQVLRDHV